MTNQKKHYICSCKSNTMIEEDNYNKKRNNNNDTSLTTGIILITLGVLFLVSKYFPSINFTDIWPFLLIVVGVIIIFKGNRN